MSLSIDELLSYGGVTFASPVQGTQTAASESGSVSGDTDSYISSVGSQAEALPCENYNDILKVMKNAEAEGNRSDTDSETAQNSGAVSGSGGGGGSDSGSEEETTTQIVTINGVTYLETTTVSDGVTSVQRTVIGGADKLNADN